MKLRRTIPFAAVATLLGWRALRRARAVDLRGQVALVTGGSRGLGLLIARELARQGCKLVICARDVGELKHAREDLLPRGAEAVLAVPCDVSDRDDVQRLVEKTHLAFGRIDVLVNNAGMIQVGSADHMDAEDFERSMDVNFWGTVNATLAVLPEMRARKQGRIVNITSIGGALAVPHLLPSDCAKSASLGFSEGLHAELSGRGVVVTTVIPGLMRTGGHRHAWFSAGEQFPLFSMDAKRAARRIVAACRMGEAVLTLTWQAKLLRVGHALMPGVVDGVFGVMNRLLPSPSAAGHVAVRGDTLATH